MRVRALDANGDMQFGRNSRDFIANTPAVVAQRVKTRLGLQVGDWFLNILDGTPYRTAVFGMRTNATRDPAIRARILGTPGCTGIDTYASQQSRQTRAWTVQARITTQFGQTIVAAAVNAPNVDVRIGR